MRAEPPPSCSIRRRARFSRSPRSPRSIRTASATWTPRRGAAGRSRTSTSRARRSRSWRRRRRSTPERSLSTTRSTAAGGTLTIGTNTIHEHGGKGWSTLTIGDILAHSSNIGIAHVAMTLGRAPFYKSVRAFGFGEKTGVELEGETAGLLADTSGWSALTLPTMAFGQEIGVTVLQMARAYAAIANGGVLPPLHLVDSIRDSNRSPDAANRRIERPAPRRLMSEDTARRLRILLAEGRRDGNGKSRRDSGLHRRRQDGHGAEGGAGRRVFEGPLRRLVHRIRARRPAARRDRGRRGRAEGEDLRRARSRRRSSPRSEQDVLRILREPPRARRRDASLHPHRGPRRGRRGRRAQRASECRRPRARREPDGEGTTRARTACRTSSGKSARDAVRLLASRGFSARLSGTGFVVSQEPPAGSPAERGGSCALQLAPQVARGRDAMRLSALAADLPHRRAGLFRGPRGPRRHSRLARRKSRNAVRRAARPEIRRAALRGRCGLARRRRGARPRAGARRDGRALSRGREPPAFRGPRGLAARGPAVGAARDGRCNRDERQDDDDVPPRRPSRPPPSQARVLRHDRLPRGWRGGDPGAAHDAGGHGAAADARGARRGRRHGRDPGVLFACARPRAPRRVLVRRRDLPQPLARPPRLPPRHGRLLRGEVAPLLDAQAGREGGRQSRRRVRPKLASRLPADRAVGFFLEGEEGVEQTRPAALAGAVAAAEATGPWRRDRSLRDGRRARDAAQRLEVVEDPASDFDVEVKERTRFKSPTEA